MRRRDEAGEVGRRLLEPGGRQPLVGRGLGLASYELLVRFAAYTGLRAGELVALRVRHLNLLRRRCEVGESATEVDGRLVWEPTKTYARRTVPLPGFLCEQLAAYLAERPHGPDDLVFSGPAGWSRPSSATPRPR